MNEDKYIKRVLTGLGLLVAAIIVGSATAGDSAPAKAAPVVTKYTLYSKYCTKQRDVFVTNVDSLYTVTYQDHWYDMRVEGFEDLGEALEEMALMLEL